MQNVTKFVLLEREEQPGNTWAKETVTISYCSVRAELVQLACLDTGADHFLPHLTVYKVVCIILSLQELPAMIISKGRRGKGGHISE